VTPGILTRDEAAARAALVADVAYEVALDLTDPAAERFTSDTTVRFACSRPGASTFLELLDATDVRVWLNGAEITGAHDPATGRVRLAGLLDRNEVRVRARCRYEHTGVGLHRFRDPVDGETYLYTQFEPADAQRVFACFDQPDVKATFSFRVAAPDDWAVISNGAPVGVDGGYRVFATTPPLPTYVTAVVAGPYHRESAVHDGIDLGLWCRRSLAPHLDPDEIFEITRAGFDFFHRVFGHRYPFGKYDQCFVPEFNAGAMENAGCVTFLEQHIFRSRVTDAERERRAETILHEMAHMWFGDLVTMRWWDDLWLNESFATYMAFHALAAATRFRGAWATFANGWKTWAVRQDELPTTHPIVADIPDTAATKVNFDGITYAKGASVLRQLVAWVGEEAFFAGTARYFSRHAWGNATLADFLAALEEVSGRDLGAWSAEWLQTAGVNTLRPTWQPADGPAGQVFSAFAIEQTAPRRWPTLRSHRLAIGLYERDGERLVRTERIELDVTGARTPVPALDGRRVPPLVLVNDDDLAYAKVRLDPGSLATLETDLGAVADPLARALCWSAAWDMVRDAELPARRYLSIVLGNVAGETEIGVVQSLLRQAAGAVELYADPSARDALRRRLADRAHRLLHAAAPASDLQLAYAGAFIDAARDEKYLHALQRLLDGTLTIEGLAVDTELRWRIVIALAAAGVADDGLVDAELERDPTDMGRRRAATARAARPDPAAKEAAWERLVDPSLPFATMRAVMAGFNRADQGHLVAAFVDRYFEALPRVWAERVPEVALSFTEGLYPTPAASEELRARTEAFVAGTDVPPPFRRLLLEGADNVARILAARACDASAD
jgi:aminopeptidase N